jgi:hypothetical protein
VSEFDVTLVTCEQLPEPDLDEAPLREALEASGLSVRKCVWDDGAVDWSAGRLTLIRSTWDYYRKRDDFVAWARAVEAVSMLCNPASVVEWNSHKGYLLSLPLRGIPVVPTVMVEGQSDLELREICEHEGWPSVVVKPSVSAGSYETHAMREGDFDEAIFARLVAAGDVLVQPYMESVDDYGERSLIYIDDEFSHCVRKHPRFAGEAEEITGPYEPTRAELAVADAAIDLAAEVAGQALLYGRVDVVHDREGQPMVAEIEVLEPSLFFRFGEEGLRRMVAAIGGRLGL